MADPANSTTVPAIHPGLLPDLLPAPLPALGAALSRRYALFGAVAVAIAPTAVLPAPAPASSDLRLAAMVDELAAIFEDMEAQCVSDQRDCHDHPAWDGLIEREQNAIGGICDTRAEGPAGLVAKAKALMVPSVYGDFELTDRVAASLADDVVRLMGRPLT